MKTDPFKACSNCRAEWATLDDFLGDSSVRLGGYQINTANLANGLFLFNHEASDCGTTMAVYVSAFTALSEHPVFSPSTDRPETCPGRCLHQDDLAPCPEKCECNWVREVMQIIRNWNKQAA